MHRRTTRAAGRTSHNQRRGTTMARFLRRVFDRLVQAESDTITVDTFDFQAMRDRYDAARAENRRLNDAITVAVGILDPHTVDPWAYRPGAFPEHAEDVRAAVSVLAGCLNDEAVPSGVEQLSKVRAVVEAATADDIGSLVLLSELRHILGIPARVNGAAA